MSTALRTEWRGATLAAMQDHVAGVTRTYHLDHQGTVQCLTDDNGVVTDRFSCDAWGNEFKRTGTSINRHWYIGHLGYYRQVDQALDYVRARTLSVGRGAWLSLDPVGRPPTFLLPLNPRARDAVGVSGEPGYGYAANQPELMVDPSGLKCVATNVRFTHNTPHCMPKNLGGDFRPTGDRGWVLGCRASMQATLRCDKRPDGSCEAPTGMWFCQAVRGKWCSSVGHNQIPGWFVNVNGMCPDNGQHRVSTLADNCLKDNWYFTVGYGNGGEPFVPNP